MSQPATKAKKVLPYADYYSEVNVKQRAEIIAITEADAEWKCQGFVEMVLDKGPRAIGPPAKTSGPPRSWQEIGRTLFGVERFNGYLRAAIERRQSAQQVSQSVR